MICIYIYILTPNGNSAFYRASGNILGANVYYEPARTYLKLHFRSFIKKLSDDTCTCTIYACK